MSVSLHCIGAISIGEMGLGVARLLIAHGYRVVTFVADRRYGTCPDIYRLNATGVVMTDSNQRHDTKPSLVCGSGGVSVATRSGL